MASPVFISDNLLCPSTICPPMLHSSMSSVDIMEARVDPTETLAVTFFEQPCLAVRSTDGTIYVSIRDLCEAVGLARPSQVRRLRADEDLRDGMQSFRVPTPGGVQDQEFLILEFVPTWMTSINRARATPIVRERLRFLRLFAIREVYNAFAQVAGLPPGESRAIEDLAELTRFDDAMIELARRQQAIEESQDRARSAWREIDGRVRALEDKLGGDTISAAQRGYIYQLVQHWAQARLDHEPTLSRTAAFAGCWAALKTRYRIAKYEHLPATKYTDCVQYIRSAYHRLTGIELDLPAQGTLDLE